MIDRNESLRDKIATIVQAGYSQRKTSVETADEIRSKISFLFILTGLARENAELRKDKARLKSVLILANMALDTADAHLSSDEGNDLACQEIEAARAAIDAAMEAGI